MLAIMAASSASPVPTDIEEDYSNVGYMSHPEVDLVLYRVGDNEDELWNDMVEADEPRHLERRSPLFNLPSLPDPITLKLRKKQLPLDKKFFKKFKKPKLIKKKIIFSPVIKKVAKKGAKKFAIVGVPTAALAAGSGLAGFALTSSLPALPALPAIPALGAAGAGAGLTNIPPFFPIPPLQAPQNRDRN